MEPRRSRHAKWTELPQDYVKQVIAALKDSFADEVKSGKFVFEGRIYADEVIVRMGFLENGRLRQMNFEVSVDLRPGKDDTVKLIGICVDVGATMLEELFSSESDEDFPRVWQSYDVEGRKVYLQFSSENTDLESEANRLLGQNNDSLVKDDDQDEQGLSEIKAKLGLDDEDFEDEDLDEDTDEDPDPVKH